MIITANVFEHFVLTDHIHFPQASQPPGKWKNPCLSNWGSERWMDLLTQASETFHMGTWLREGTVRSSRGGLQRERNHSHYKYIFSTEVWKRKPSQSKLQWWLKIFHISLADHSPSLHPGGVVDLEPVLWSMFDLDQAVFCREGYSVRVTKPSYCTGIRGCLLQVPSLRLLLPFHNSILDFCLCVYLQEDKAPPTPISFFLFFFKQTLCHG